MTGSARYIVPIVEGLGEMEAAPALLRRILHERSDHYDVNVLPPKNANGKGRLVRRFEDFLRYAASEDGCAAILVLLDADDDCPVELGTELASRASSINVHVPTVIVCAKREYESWFLASDENFQGEAEEYSGAKQWLNRRFADGLTYKETKDQVRFSATMDMDAAYETSRSFRRLCNAVDELVQFVDAGEVVTTPGGKTPSTGDGGDREIGVAKDIGDDRSTIERAEH